MKQKTIFIMVLLVFQIALTLAILGAPQDEDNYGKVIGQIVDPETGKPVNEVFDIVLYDGIAVKFSSRVLFHKESDAQGRFVLDLPQYTYYLQFYPMSKKSKYCFSLSPFKLKEEERDILKIEKGKITYFQKKAPLGGTLKIYMADTSNNKIVPTEIFHMKFRISCSVKFDDQNPNNIEGDLEMGEVTYSQLHPGLYSVDIGFDGIGSNNIKKKDIRIEIGKTTEVYINLDLNNNTGVEGIVTDAAGQPMEDSDLNFSSADSYYVAFTNKNGYYKLTGMAPGDYSLFIICSINQGTENFGVTGFYDKEKINIEKNKLLHLDCQSKYTKAELEKR
jgi:hypothetical protein